MRGLAESAAVQCHDRRVTDAPSSTPPLPTSIWVLAGASLASQVATVALRGIKAENEVSLVGSVLLGVVLVWFFSVGVIRARMVRVVIVWIVLVLSGIAELIGVVDPDDANAFARALIGLVTTVVSIAALERFRHTDWYAWQRTKPPTDQGESISGLVAIAVAVGALGGLVGPAEDGFRVELNAGQHVS